MSTNTITAYEDLLCAEAVRSQAARVTAAVRAGEGLFEVHDERLTECAAHVVAITLQRYPTLEIPYHSRWRHFAAPGATVLETRLLDLMSELDPIEAARTGFDLVIPSVLLDAGAGSAWTYLAPEAELRIGRSEGLGLASLEMFLSGSFGVDGSARTDASALAALSAEELSDGFQVSASNPLVGVDGRLDVLRRLGDAMADRPDVFPNGRPGDLVDRLVSDPDRTVAAPGILASMLDVLAPIWPERTLTETTGVALGDAWHYEPFGDGPASIVPFHKLSQWLSYSLAETLERSGVTVTDLDGLTGLPEYRNGGLLVETGVLSLRDDSLAGQAHRPESRLIVEWRALTITLLDELAELVRRELDAPSMLLAEILEGGTWAAGRALAFERTDDGSPPLHLDSDGTVF